MLLLCYPILEVVLPGLSRLAGLEMHNPAHAYDVLKMCIRDRRRSLCDLL